MSVTFLMPILIPACISSSLALCNPMDYIYSPWNFPGQNTEVGSLLCSRESPQASCIAGGFFTSWAIRETPDNKCYTFNPHINPATYPTESWLVLKRPQPTWPKFKINLLFSWLKMMIQKEVKASIQCINLSNSLKLLQYEGILFFFFLQKGNGYMYKWQDNLPNKYILKMLIWYNLFD